MNEDSKVIFISHPYYAVNNPSNNLRIYKKAKNSNQWTYIQCKDKEEYRTKIREYILGFFNYARNEEKAQTSIKDFLEVNNNSSMFDYFMGGKKSEEIMKLNKMKREEMAMLPDGSFLQDESIPLMQKRWANYIENSNIQLAVLSFNQSYVDQNISVKELHKKIATDLMPKFLSYCGYEDPKKNLEWIVALHSDRENNYHFHISWIEKKKCYRNRDNKLEHRIQLLIDDNEKNFFKRQASLTIERNKFYTPALIELEKNFEDLKSYFDSKDNNFTLKNIKDIALEEKIIKLGFLLNEVRNTDKKYIKYNSLPKNEVGHEIRQLTQEIKKEIYKNKDIKRSQEKINDSINKINDILLDIDKNNNISNIGFENAFDNKMIKNKIDKVDSYILNSIVNHALYNFNRKVKKVKVNNFKIEDIINQIALESYKNDFNNYSIKKVSVYKHKLLYMYLGGKRNKNKIINALNRLSYQQDKVAEEFYEMLSIENNDFEK